MIVDYFQSLELGAAFVLEYVVGLNSRKLPSTDVPADWDN